MSRRLDIGVASYRNPDKLARTLLDIRQMSTTDWRCFIIHNPSEGEDDERAGTVIAEVAKDSRFVPIWMGRNAGYAGAVNKLAELAQTEYFCHLDNDIRIRTKGWDEALCGYLDRFHELGIIYPNGGHRPIKRPGYQEVLWGVGFAWVISRAAATAVEFVDCDQEFMDTTLGHHEEVDLSIRLKLAGYRLGAAPEVQVEHDATSTNDPTHQARINAGVVRWCTKWTQYFGGKNLTYHSPNVIRFDEWPTSALHNEEYFLGKLPGLNDNPEVVTIDGQEFDLLRVPRLKGYYRGRII